jgi:hypothetical protein
VKQFFFFFKYVLRCNYAVIARWPASGISSELLKTLKSDGNKKIHSFYKMHCDARVTIKRLIMIYYYVFEDAPHLLKRLRNWILHIGFILKSNGNIKLRKEHFESLIQLTNTKNALQLKKVRY